MVRSPFGECHFAQRSPAKVLEVARLDNGVFEGLVSHGKLHAAAPLAAAAALHLIALARRFARPPDRPAPSGDDDAILLAGQTGLTRTA